MKAFLEWLGGRTIAFFTMVHEISLLAFRTVRSLPRRWFYRRQFVEQLTALIEDIRRNPKKFLKFSVF
jgi:hypothetical protein